MTCRIEQENEELKKTIAELKEEIKNLKQQVRDDMVAAKESANSPECTT